MTRGKRRPLTRWTLGHLRALIRNRASLLDRRTDACFITQREPLHLTCLKCGCKWQSSKEALQKDRWCPRCTGVELWTYGRARRYAQERGGKVDSSLPDSAPVGTGVQMSCKQGHIWRATKKCMGGGSWCPRCSRNRDSAPQRWNFTAGDLLSLILGKGELLSSVSENDRLYDRHEVRLRCSACGSEWTTKVGSVKRGAWCHHCARNTRWTVGRVRAIASKRGGELITSLDDSHAVLSREHVTLKCGCGHRWKISPSNLNNGHWCPKCCGKSDWTLGRVRQIVADRNGAVVSKLPDDHAVKAASDRIRVRCAYGHEWETDISRLQRSWCGVCASGQGEEICRAYMETLFGEPFPRSHPDFLRHGTTGRNLELDGYCETLKVAFEHHGLQHYKEVSLFRDSHISLVERQRRDRIKRLRCKKHNILLVEIPELHLLTPLSSLREVILRQCRDGGRDAPFPNADIDASKLVAISSFDLALTRAREYALTRNGECLSTHYTGGKAKMRWRCSEGHEWDAVCNAVVGRGTWCPQCGKIVARDSVRRRMRWDSALERCRMYAASMGGRVLSTDYRGVLVPLAWQCSEGHIFNGPPVRFLPTKSYEGRWCTKCKTKREMDEANQLTFERCRRHALKLGGELLSKSCCGVRVNVRWKCRCGNEWDASPGTVLGYRKSATNAGRRGTWCKRCRRIEAERKRQKTVRKTRRRLLPPPLRLGAQPPRAPARVRNRRRFRAGC